MKACSIVIKGREISIEELKDWIKRGDTKELLEALQSEELPPILRKIVARFAVDKMEDSVMELQSKRNAKAAGKDIGEYPTKDEVNEWVHPRGQFNDYNTQKEIHKNTYSGMSLTGIAANSGKEIGYTFEGTPVVSIINTIDQTIYEGEQLRGLVNSFRYDTVAELLRKRPEYLVHSREEAFLKEDVHVRFNGHSYDRLSRNEIGPDGSLVTNPITGYVVSIFETIDSIINLAIDNVKEQKLFVYGITNSNANAFFAALSLGVPLNTLVRMFTTPSIRSLSNSSRIYPESVHRKANEIITNLSAFSFEDIYSSAEQFLTASQYKSLLTQFKWSAADKDSLMEKMAKYIANNGSLNDDVLDNVYIGKASKVEEYLSDLIALKSLNKLMTIGEEMFTNAQTLSLLRKMPSTMSKIDYLSDKPREYANFSYVATLDDVDIKEYIDRAKEYIIANDPNYAASSNKTDYINKFVEGIKRVSNTKVIETELATELESKFRNAMAYATMRKEVKTTDKSSFKNMSIMNIPHVYSAWRVLNLLKNVSERSFALHNQLIKTYMLRVLEDANLFTSYNKYEMVEQLTLEFMKALSSGLSLNVGGDVVDLNTDKETGVKGDRALFGVEAWSQKFIDRILKAKSEDTTDNMFLKNLEIQSRGDLNEMGIYSDKVEDFKIKEGIKQGFLELYKDPSTKHLALDTLKYSILAEGLLYSRSTISLIFPPSFVASYSRAFEDSIATIINPNKRLALARLDSMYNVFLHQFLRNYPDTASYVEGHKPESTGSVSKGDYSITAYSGIERGEEPFHYDLKYPGLNPKYAKKFIKRYGDEIYIRIEAPFEHTTYYRQITEKTAHKFYEIDSTDFEQKFDTQQLQRPVLMVPSSYLKGNKLLDPNTLNTYVPGDTIYIFDRSSVKPKTLRVYTISKGNPTHGYNVIPTDKTVQLFTKQNNNIFTDYPTLIGSNALSTINNTHGRVRTISRAQADPNGFAIVAGDQGSFGSEKVLALNDSTKLSAITLLDPTKTYYVQSKILDDLKDENRKAFAEALYKQVGYVDRNIDDVIRYEEDSITLSYKLKAISKNRPHLRVGNTHDSAYTVEELNTALTEGYLVTSYKDQTVFKKLNQGDVVYLGLKGSLPLFAYVEEITTIYDKPSFVKMSLIPPTLAVSMLSDNYGKEAYATLLQEHNKC